MAQVTRISIKRRSIQREYCTCHGMQIIDINGNSWMLMSESVKTEDYLKFLDTTDVCPTVYIQYSNSPQTKNKIQKTLDKGIGIVLSTDRPLDDKVIKSLAGNPLNSIWFHVNLLRNSVSDLPENGGSEVKPIIEMFHTAKLYGISLALEMDVPQHVDTFLNTLETVEVAKNFITDIFLWSLPPSEKGNGLQTGLHDGLSQQAFIDRLSLFLKHKRVSLENLRQKSDEQRVRHQSSSKSISRIILYGKKDDGKFYLGAENESPCPICGKTKFM